MAFSQITKCILVLLSTFALSTYTKNIDVEHQIFSRASFKLCDIDNTQRLDCGYHGITEEECSSRECCYQPTASVDTPRCYYSKDMMADACLLDVLDRRECGFPGIRKEQCLYEGCCYQPRNEHNVPWCYKGPSLPINDQEYCGKTPIPPNVYGRIHAGEEARPHSWPWQVSLYRTSYGDHWCGGNIINNEWILTAGHCVYGATPDDYVIRAGLHNRTGPHDHLFQESTVTDIIIHEHYDYIFNDVALMKLRTPFTYSDGVLPVCVPDQGEAFEQETRSYNTGWGLMDSNVGEASYELMQAAMPLLSDDTCADWYINYADNFRPDTMICAGYEEGGRASCNGDSGGPLVISVRNRWILVGVTSWSVKPCGTERAPSVFAEVSSFRDWINTKIDAN